MRILGISGSPRCGGNTDVAVQAVLEELSGQVETEFLRIADLDIAHCMGCKACKFSHPGRCAIVDGFQLVLRKWETADLVVIGNPVFWHTPPGVMIDFIHRLFCYYYVYLKAPDDAPNPRSPVDGKKLATLAIAGATGATKVNEWIAGCLSGYGAEALGSLELIALEIGDLAGNNEQLQILKTFAGELLEKI